MRILVVGDLHLYDKELRSTKGYVANNQVMLDNLYRYIEDDEGIKLVVFLGDIQHKTPKSLGESYKWRQWFKKLGQLMLSRYDGSYEVYPASTIEGAYPVYSLRGNHDNEVKQRRRDDFTFFDELLHEGLIQNPESIITPNSLLILNNYGEVQEVPNPIKQTIGLYHDLVYHDNSPSYVGLIKQTEPDSWIDGQTQLGNINLALVGHIHEPEPEVVIHNHLGQDVRMMQVGSMGRTSLTPENQRDVGYCALVDDESLAVERVEIPVLPAVDYFNLQELVNQQRTSDSYADFGLDIDEVNIEVYSVEDMISQSEASIEAKQLALELYRALDNN